MKTKLLGIALFGLTLAAIVYYPQLMAKNTQIEPPIQQHITAEPKIDVLFSPRATTAALPAIFAAPASGVAPHIPTSARWRRRCRLPSRPGDSRSVPGVWPIRSSTILARARPRACGSSMPKHTR